MIVINGENKILGRLATFVAKQLLLGNQVVVVNTEKILIKRDPKKTQEQYLQRVKRGNPYSGPFFPKRADLIFRRTVRGMLPYKTTRGRNAFKKLKVFIGIPKEFENANFVDVKEAENNHKYKTISLKELSVALGTKYYE